MDRRPVAKMLQETRITGIKVDLRKTIQNMELAQNPAYVQLQLMKATRRMQANVCIFHPFSLHCLHTTHTHIHTYTTFQLGCTPV